MSKAVSFVVCDKSNLKKWEWRREEDWDFEVFWDEFSSFLNESMKVDGNKLFNDGTSLLVFCWENIDSVEDIDEIEDGETIDNKNDFESRSEDWNQDEEITTVHLLLTKKIEVNVDLSESDNCKEGLTMNFYDFDLQNDERAANPYQDLTDKIGKLLKDDKKWDSKYSLIEMGTNKSVNDLKSFVQVFTALDNQTTVKLSLKVGGQVSSKKVFIFQQGNDSVTWLPDEKVPKWATRYLAIKKLIKNHFQVDIKKVPLRYYESESGIKKPNTIESDILDRNNLESYWNLLYNSKKSVMYFVIGQVPVSSELKEDEKENENDSKAENLQKEAISKIENEKLEKNGNRILVISGQIKNDSKIIKIDFSEKDDYDEIFDQLIEQLSKYYSFSGKEYDDMPFSMLKVDNDNWDKFKSKLLSYNVNEYYKLIKDCGLNEHIESSDEISSHFDEIAESNESNVLCIFVHYKQFLLFEFDKKSDGIEWAPLQCGESKKTDWDDEFSKLLERVCNNFGIVSGTCKMTTQSGEDISNGKKLNQVWDELPAPHNNSPSFITVNCQGSRMQLQQPKAQEDGDTKSEEKGLGGKEAMVNEIIGMDKEVIEKQESETVAEDLQFLYDYLSQRCQLAKSLGNEGEASNEVFSRVNQRFDSLLRLMMSDGYDKKNETFSAISEAKECINNKNWDKAASLLKSSIDAIRPFNMKEMLSLYSKTEEAALKVQDKDIMLVIGHTGAGKSTTIHFLAGSEMKQDKSTGHIEPINVTNVDLQAIRTEYKVANSVTRYISTVNVVLKDANVKFRGKGAKPSVVLCDSPGFGDTAGAEVDVANGLGIIRAVSLARSVKILLTIGVGDFEQRFTGARNLCHTLAKILPNFSQYLECISVLFTKMNKTQEQIQNIFTRALDEMEEMGVKDEVVTELFEFFSGLNPIIALNPLADDRTQILKTMFDPKRTKWIEYPKEEFKEFVTEESLEKIKRQMLLHKECVNAELARSDVNKKMDYDLLYTKLNELVEANKILKLSAIADTIDECKDMIGEKWNKQCESAICTLEISGDTRGLVEFSRDIDNYDALLNDLKSRKCEKLKSDLLTGANITDPGLLETKLTKTMDNILAKCTLDPQSKIYFEKAAMMTKKFKHLTGKYESKLKLMDKLVQEKADEAKIAIEKNNFANSKEIMCEIGLCSHLADILDTVKISHSLETHVNSHLSKYFEEISGDFMIESVGNVKSNEMFESCKKSLNILESGRDVFMIPALGVNDNVGKNCKLLYDDGISVIVSYFVTVSNQVSEMVGKKVQNAISNEEKDKRAQAKTLVQQMNKIQEMNDDLATKTSKTYNNTLGSIVQYLYNVKRTFDETVDAIEKGNKNIDYKSLVECVEVLDECNWVFEMQNGGIGDSISSISDGSNSGTNEVKDSIVKKLGKHISSLLEKAETLFIDLSEPQSIEKVGELMKTLKKLGDLEKLLPQISEMIKSVVRQLTTCVISTLDEIDKKFGVSDKKDEQKENKEEEDVLYAINGKEANQAIIFLHECKRVSWISISIRSNNENGEKEKEISVQKRVIDTENKLKDYLLGYGKLRLKMMENCLDYLEKVDGKDSGTYAMQKGNELSNGLEELRNIHNRYPLLNKYLTQDDDLPLAKWPRYLEEAYNELHGKLVTLQNTNNPRIQVALTHVRYLRKVDWFLSDFANKKSIQFGNLYCEFQSSETTSNDFESLTEAIEMRDFMRIQHEMILLDEIVSICTAQNKSGLEMAKKTLNRAKKMVGQELIDLFEHAKSEVIKLKSELSFEKMEQLKSTFGKLKQARTYCLDYISEADQEEVSSTEKVTQNRLYGLAMEIKQRAVAAIVRCDFDIAENELKNIENMEAMLGNVLSKCGSNEKDKDTLKEEIEKVLNEKLKEIKDTFLGIKLKGSYNPYSKCHISPRELHQKLNVVMKRDEKYDKVWRAISEDIIRKFHLGMDDAKTSSYEPFDIYRTLEKAFNSLPAQLQSVLKDGMDELKTELENKEKHEFVLGCLDEKNYAALNDRMIQLGGDGQNQQRLQSMQKMITDTMGNHIRHLQENLRNSLNIGAFQTRDGMINHVKKCIDDAFQYFFLVCDIASHVGIDSATKKPLMYGRGLGKYQAAGMDYMKDCLGQRIENVKQYIRSKEKKKSIIDRLNCESTMIALLVSKNRSKTIDGRCLFDENIRTMIDEYLCKVKEYLNERKETFDRCKMLMPLNLKAIAECINTMKDFDEKENGCVFLDKLQVTMGDSAKFESFCKERSTMVKEMVDILNKYKDAIMTVTLLRNPIMDKEKTRSKLFKEWQDQMRLFAECGSIDNILAYDTRKNLFIPCFEHIKKAVSGICDQAGDYIRSFENSDKMDENTLNNINSCFNVLQGLQQINLIEFIESIKKSQGNDAGNEVESSSHGGISNIVKKSRTEILKQIRNVGTKARGYIFELSDLPKFVDCLIELEKARTLLTIKEFCKECEIELENALNAYKKQNPGRNNLSTLAEALEDHESHWGGVLCANNNIFQGESVSRFNKKTREQTIGNVVNTISCNDNSIDTEKIESRYSKCMETYKRMVKEHLKKGEDIKLDALVANIKTLAANTAQAMTKQVKIAGITIKSNTAADAMTSLFGKSKFTRGIWNKDFKECAIELIANIFAIWTLENSKSFYDGDSGANDDDSYLMQPRVAQIVSILRMLSIDDSGSELVRHLIEIGTGEGKSLTLGVTCCILALLGYDVSCACYSKYLSDRDYKAFEDLFKLLDLTDHIHYGTFNYLCEHVINEDGNIRQMVESMVLNDDMKSDAGSNGKGAAAAAAAAARSKVLLIDEVDVFFNKDFYGNVYTPGAVITMTQKPCIKWITDLIWNNYITNNHKSTLLLSEIQELDEFKQCEKEFGETWIGLFVECIKDMLADIQTFESSNQYILQNDCIGYKEGDRITTSAVYGYKTLFTYYLEHSKNNISDASLCERIGIYLKCGGFSYAEIPKRFDVILGVSGTLQSLSDYERKVMKDKSTYNIQRYTYMPSLFGKRELVFAKGVDIKYYPSQIYHDRLNDEIGKRMMGDNDANARAVFVVFESKTKLNDFYNSKAFATFRGESQILTEECLASEKNKVVRLAPTAGKVTLLTGAFGRGTDFQVKDKKVIKNGGPHVIQTFLSLQLSEEIQIQGRTARQGGQGSYSMILDESEMMEGYGITNDELKEAENEKKLYDLLHKKRKDKFEKEYKENEEFVKCAAKSHEKAMKLKRHLLDNDTKKVEEMLLELNRGASSCSSRAKVCVLVDATGSMGDLLQKAKNTIQEVYDRVSTILVENNRDGKEFEIQFIAYRNYDADENDLLQCSGWCSDGTTLRNFLVNVDDNYGWGNEAIEVALHHVSKAIQGQNDFVSQMILIGDAAPNSKEDVSWKRNDSDYARGEEYWKSTKEFSEMVFWKDELKFFKDNNIKINTFWLDSSATKDFETIAKETGGICKCLDMEDPTKARETLIEIVSTIVLDAAGGSELVQAYQKRFLVQL